VINRISSSTGGLNGMATARKKTTKAKPAGFDPPQQPDWHRMIAEAAYYRAQTRGFEGDRRLEDWLVAEQEVKHQLSA
jgi:Protein of unknown function (DUF2934)